MAIIFQLFHAEALTQLDENQLNLLRQAVRPQSALSPLTAPTIDTTLLDSSLLQDAPLSDLRAQTAAQIQNRARQVFQQITGQVPRERPALELSEPLAPQILHPEDYALLDTPSKRLVFDMAISCEVMHFNAFVHLLSVKKLAYDKFVELHPQHQFPAPAAPDTVYSPLNPNSPLDPTKIYLPNPNP
jgi:hypothetical protein